MGGGQPVKIGECPKEYRTEGLYTVDASKKLKKPDANPFIQKAYKEFLPGKEHELLHNEGY